MPNEADPLFQLPLADFTAARNALAVRLRKEGREEDAAAVKRLTKPSVSAWTVNQLFWRHRPVFDRLMAAGRQLRLAQAAHLGGKAADIREPLEARREVLAELSRLAADALAAASHAPGPDLMRRITTTLEALSTYGESAGAPQLGRLSADVDPPGFETLAALVPASGSTRRAKSGPPTVLPFRRTPAHAPAAKRALSEADRRREQREQDARRAQAIKHAERELRDARAAAARAEAALKKAAARVKAAEAARAEAEQRLEAATAELAAAKTAARQVAAEAEEAAQAVTDAERGLEKIRG
jgi:hypothetical protein